MQPRVKYAFRSAPLFPFRKPHGSLDEAALHISVRADCTTRERRCLAREGRRCRWQLLRSPCVGKRGRGCRPSTKKEGRRSPRPPCRNATRRHPPSLAASWPLVSHRIHSVDDRGPPDGDLRPLVQGAPGLAGALGNPGDVRDAGAGVPSYAFPGDLVTGFTSSRAARPRWVEN